MGNKKSVVCGYCHTLGHNRLTCPQLHADIVRIKEMHGDDHPIVQEHETSRASLSLSASKRAKMPRSCTYCHTLGHNRRTCAVLESDRQIAIAKNAAWRSLYAANVKEFGLGVGAMLRFRHDKVSSGRFAKDSTALWMVLKHEWGKINYVSEGHLNVVCQQISNNMRRARLTVPSSTATIPSMTIHGWVVVSPSTDFKTPDNWLTGESGIDVLFENKDKESRII